MRNLLIASILIALAAMSVPGMLARYLEKPAGEAAGARSDKVEALVDRRLAAAPRQVEIKVARDGHFYVDADINLRSVRMMVDTGATVIALRQSDAEAVGIRAGPGDFTHVVQTANGATGAAEAELDTVAIGDIEIEDVRALVIPDHQLAVSLLGGSFLGRVERFEVADGRLVIEN
ncbi:MAG TPA: TIGR02281 family clan AA aspartic protease [Propylenella sp.]